jgi:hypothetical protein
VNWRRISSIDVKRCDFSSKSKFGSTALHVFGLIVYNPKFGNDFQTKQFFKDSLFQSFQLIFEFKYVPNYALIGKIRISYRLKTKFWRFLPFLSFKFFTGRYPSRKKTKYPYNARIRFKELIELYKIMLAFWNERDFLKFEAFLVQDKVEINLKNKSTKRKFRIACQNRKKIVTWFKSSK